MLTVVEVKTKKQQRDFLNYPLKLYKGNLCFVPPLYMDEKKIFKRDYVYYDTCEAVYYNAYRDGEMVGRISAILQKASNEKKKEKRVRFTRFDSINDREVAAALFRKVEEYALSKGMDTICGPLGFSDLEREGLLVEGFDQLSTFEEQYNAPYYKDLIESLGYVKEVDWVESKITAPKGDLDLAKSAEFVLNRYRLHMGSAKNIREFLRKYKDAIFEMIDKTYDNLYGTVPLTEGTKKMIVDNFNLIIDIRYVAVVLDENDDLVCFGLCMPAMADVLKGTNGRLTPWRLLRLLRAIKHPKVLDLALIGVDEKYKNRGVSIVFTSAISDFLTKGNIEYCETNLNLEDNYAIRNQWKRFESVEHKRRRSYVKKLTADQE